jgi:signal transduction histidine kinase
MGLAAALRWYAKQFSARTGLEVSVAADGIGRALDAPREIVLFRIAQEALNNVAKHAHARHVDVALTTSGREWALSISDDGVGVDPEGGGHTSGSGLGLVTMRERSRAIGGRVDVRRRPEGGTAVTVSGPLGP